MSQQDFVLLKKHGCLTLGKTFEKWYENSMDSICVNHHDRAGIYRCATCHKPLCAECVVKSRGSVYCSQTCADNAAKFQDNFRTCPRAGLFRQPEEPDCFPCWPGTARTDSDLRRRQVHEYRLLPKTAEIDRPVEALTYLVTRGTFLITPLASFLASLKFTGISTR